MTVFRQYKPNSFIMHILMAFIVLALFSPALAAPELSETGEDGMRFEIRRASMGKVEGWKSVTTPWNQPIWVSPTISLSNIDVAQASAVPRGDIFSVALLLTEEGALKLARLTKAHAGEHVAVIINDQAVSVPKIMSEIAGGRAEIAGNFTEEEARSVAKGILAR